MHIFHEHCLYINEKLQGKNLVVFLLCITFEKM